MRDVNVGDLHRVAVTDSVVIARCNAGVKMLASSFMLSKLRIRVGGHR
jgi:hypothetical protein